MVHLEFCTRGWYNYWRIPGGMKWYTVDYLLHVAQEERKFAKGGNAPSAPLNETLIMQHMYKVISLSRRKQTSTCNDPLMWSMSENSLLCTIMSSSIVYTFTLRMHAEVDNEEGSTICLYKCMPYKNVWYFP